MRCRTIILCAYCCFFLLHNALSFASTEGIRTYQPVSLQIPPDRKQAIGIDIDHYYSAGDLWEVLRQQFRLPLEEDNPRVQEKMKWYFNHPDYLVRTMKRATPWLYFILEQAKKRHLPAELVLLPVIESAFNPFAQNAASGAGGIWQMMPGTASGYGIKQNWWYDGRFDIVASTTAALDHLAYLQGVFNGNWLLALAAYDAGEGTVQNAIRKNSQIHKKTDYWSLPLPQETQDYVPQLLALASIIRHPEFYPSNLPPVPNAPYLAEVNTGTQLDLRLAASLAHLSVQTLKKLNPGYSRPATDPNGPYRLVMPIENVAQFTENLNHLSGYPRTQWASYRVRPGETLEEIALQFHTSPDNLLKQNPSLKIPLKEGDRILVADTRTPSGETLANTMGQPLQSPSSQGYRFRPGDTLYMVRQGDTLEKITAHFHVDRNHIKMLDQKKPGALYIGQKLAISTHSSPPKNVSPLGDILYTVRANDTVEDIAERFHVSPSTLRLVNLLTEPTLTPGDQLVIPAIG